MKYLFFSICSFIFYNFSNAQISSDSAKITEVYHLLNNYIQEEKYDSCIQFFDTKSIHYFQEVTNTIYYGNKEKFLQLDPIDIFLTLMIKEKMMSMGIKDKSANNGLIISLKAGRNENQPAKGLINFSITDDWASAILTLANKETDKTILFTKEEGDWKVNITSELLHSRQKNEIVLKRFDGSKEKLLAYILENIGVSEEKLLTPLFQK